MKPTREQKNAAAFFDALGHARRMMLCRILLDHRPMGLPFGALMAQSGLNASTLTHHLGLMDRGRILRRRQKGRETWITLDSARLSKVVRGVGIPR